MVDYILLQELSDKVKEGKATQKEKDEYMAILYKNNSITKSQYDKYLTDKNNSEILKTALIIGGILLFGYILENWSNAKK